MDIDWLYSKIKEYGDLVEGPAQDYNLFIICRELEIVFASLRSTHKCSHEWDYKNKPLVYDEIITDDDVKISVWATGMPGAMDTLLEIFERDRIPRKIFVLSDYVDQCRSALELLQRDPGDLEFAICHLEFHDSSPKFGDDTTPNLGTFRCVLDEERRISRFDLLNCTIMEFFVVGAIDMPRAFEDLNLQDIEKDADPSRSRSCTSQTIEAADEEIFEPKIITLTDILQELYDSKSA